MLVPILKQRHYLIASLPSALRDNELIQLGHELVEQVGGHRARGVVMDVTALDVMDSFAARTLGDVARSIKLRGADTVIVGIQPDVAVAMVELGLTLEGIATALNLEDGLTYLEERTARSSSRGHARA